MSNFKDHFSGHAASYAKNRPVYPAALADCLASIASSRDVALDCGCGSGQLSALLAENFARVVATDASQQQIDNAVLAPNVEYRCAPAENSGLPDRSVDLVTVAQAAHWFDLDAFYAEVRRIAKPGAVLALITYGHTETGDAKVDGVVRDFYGNTLGAYWPPERALVEQGYRSLPFPFKELAAPQFSMSCQWSAQDLSNYIETWSAVRALEKAKGRDAIDAFHGALAKAWPAGNTRLVVRWPLAMRIGRVEAA